MLGASATILLLPLLKAVFPSLVLVEVWVMCSSREGKNEEMLFAFQFLLGASLALFQVWVVYFFNPLRKFTLQMYMSFIYSKWVSCGSQKNPKVVMNIVIFE